MLEILSNGALNSVQDLGRLSHLDIGVSLGGAMDAEALVMANRMVGNDPAAAGIEITIFPFRLSFQKSTRFAVTGAIAQLEVASRKMPSWWSSIAPEGSELIVEAPTSGARAYVAFAGGIDVPIVLGSRSTDLKSRFGGFSGRGLKKGDQLSLGKVEGCELSGAAFGIAPLLRAEFAAELERDHAIVRVMYGAEAGDFDDESMKAFAEQEYRLTPDCNRQGYRLQGAGLKLHKPLELLSHGILPGTIQVPPSGQPIIQMAEANTCGGYPKIANVVEADLWRLAQLRPGQKVRFKVVDRTEAMEAAQALSEEMRRIANSIALCTTANGHAHVA